MSTNTQRYKVSITLADKDAVRHWEQFVKALERFGTIVKSNAKQLVITITSELNFMTLAGRAQDAIKSIYFGADVSCSRA
jgi:hypothetical protein